MPNDSFKGHLPALAGSVIGTLLSSVIGSHLFGPKGTAIALAGGSIIFGVASWWGERAIRRLQDAASARREAARMKGETLSSTETSLINLSSKRWFNHRFRGIHYRTIGLLAGAGAATAAATVLILSQFGHQVASFTPPPTPTITITRTTAPPPPSYTPSYTPSSSYITTPSMTPSPSPTPTPTPSPSPSPSISPSASPDSSPSV